MKYSTAEKVWLGFPVALIVVLIILLAIALFWPSTAHAKTNKDDKKVPEYDLLSSCVLEAKPDPSQFHCWVDNIDKPTQMLCDSGSFKVILKPGSTLAKCTTLHLVRPEEKK